MPTDVTMHDDLAGNDQAGSGGQTDATDWKAKYAGLQAKSWAFRHNLSMHRRR
jgi:hypothetical protein